MVRIALMCCASLVMLSGCSSSPTAKYDGKGGKFTLKSQETLELAQGTKAQLKIEVDNPSAMDHPITLALKNPPKGITIEEKEPKVEKGKASAIITIVAAADSDVGSKLKLEIQGKSGEQSKTVATLLTINMSKENLVKQKEKFETELNSRYARLSAAVQKIEDKLVDKSVPVEVRKALIEKIDALLEQKMRAAKLKAELEKSDFTNWQALKQDVETAMDQLEKLVNAANSVNPPPKK